MVLGGVIYLCIALWEGKGMGDRHEMCRDLLALQQS